MKQVIIVNESLKLPRGKLAAQVAHASVASFLMASPANPQAWLNVGMPKVVLAVDDEQEMLDLCEVPVKALLAGGTPGKERNLAALIHEACSGPSARKSRVFSI